MNISNWSFKNKSGGTIVALSIFFYIILFSFLSLWKYFNFYYNALDLGIIHQVFYNSYLGNFFASSIHPPTYLGDHFTPILLLLLPFYWAYPNPETLLVLQSMILGLSAWPIYLISKNVLSKNLAALIAIAWLINPIVQNINLFEWSFLPLAIFFILWTFYFWQKNKVIPFTIFAILSLLVREDISLVIFMFGILGIINKKNIKLIVLPMLLSGIYFVSSIFITSSLAPGNSYKFFIYYSNLGGDLIEIIKNIITKPWLILSQALRPNNIIYAIGLLMPLTFIPLFGATYLLLGLVIFVQLALGGPGGSTALLQTHYSSLLLPPLFIALIYGIKNIIASKNSDQKIYSTIHANKSLTWLIVITGILYTSLAMGPIPGVIKTIISKGIIDTSSIKLGQMLDIIPQDAIVASSYKTLANLSSRKGLYSVNYAWLGKQQFLSSNYPLPEDTEYVVFDFNDLITYQLQYGSNKFYADQYEIANSSWPSMLDGFGLIAIENNVGLYKKNSENKIDLIIPVIDQEIKNQKDVILNEEIIFLGHDYNQENNLLKLFWQTNQPLQKIYRLKIITKKDNKINENIYPFAYDLLTTDIPGARKIQTNYWPQPNGDSFEKEDIQLQLIAIEKGGIEINGIRSTKDVFKESYQSIFFTLEK